MTELQKSTHDIVLLRVTQSDGGSSLSGDNVHLALQMQVDGQLQALAEWEFRMTDLILGTDVESPPHSAHGPYRLPSHFAPELKARLMGTRAASQPLWIYLVNPIGGLRGVAWEVELGDTLQVPILMLPEQRLQAPRQTTAKLEVALCASTPLGLERQSVEQALDESINAIHLVPARQLRIHVFADSVFTAGLERTWGPLIRRGELQLHKPTSMKTLAPGSVGSSGADRDDDFLHSPWLQWMRDALSTVAIDVVHFCCHGRRELSGGAILLASSPLNSLDDHAAEPIGSDELQAFIARAGAWASVFVAAEKNSSREGMRALVDEIAQNRPGPVLFHDMSRDVNGDALVRAYRFLFGERPQSPPASSSLHLYCPPYLAEHRAAEETQRGAGLRSVWSQGVEVSGDLNVRQVGSVGHGSAPAEFDIPARLELDNAHGEPARGGDKSPGPEEFEVRSGTFSDPGAAHASSSGQTSRETAASQPTPPRFFNAIAPDQVALSAQTYVVVQVAGKAAEVSEGTVAGHQSIEFVGTLTIDVHAPGLKATGPTTLTLAVPAAGDSAKLRFGFVANKVGIQQVDVMAWNGSAQVAGVTLQIAVAVEAVAAGTAEATGDMDMREPEAGEYTLDVAMEPDTRRYRFQLRSDQKEVWPPMYSEALLNARQQTYNATIANLNAQARNLYGLKMEDQATWLRGMGNLLFEQLVPEQLKVLLLEHRSKIRVLNILSEADSTPWELLFVADPDTGEGDFLAASTTVARWRYGSGPSRFLKRAKKVLVLPAEAPPQARAELQNLQRILGGADTIGDLSSLNSLMKAGGFDLLHFAAHNVNAPNTQGGAYIPFGQQRWELTFMAAVPRNRYKEHAPLVFMNACTTSGTTEFYTELASWADRFLRCGSGAFIGTLWEVRDGSARQFSETFYNELLQGKTLGDAMQSARAKLRSSNPGDPTPLAYTLYGNPLARLEQA